MKDGEGNFHDVPRADLRHRTLHSVAFAGVTEDKVQMIPWTLKCCLFSHPKCCLFPLLLIRNTIDGHKVIFLNGKLDC